MRQRDTNCCHCSSELDTEYAQHASLLRIFGGAAEMRSVARDQTSSSACTIALQQELQRREAAEGNERREHTRDHSESLLCRSADQHESFEREDWGNAFARRRTRAQAESLLLLIAYQQETERRAAGLREETEDTRGSRALASASDRSDRRDLMRSEERDEGGVLEGKGFDEDRWGTCWKNVREERGNGIRRNSTRLYKHVGPKARPAALIVI